MSKPLAVIPTYVRSIADCDMAETTLRTLRGTAEDDCDVMVVDDGSPEADLVVRLREICSQAGAELVEREVNEGFSRTVNVGLRKAVREGRDAILVNADIEFGLTKDWLGLMQRQCCSDGEGLASVVGALLVYPTGLIQHAGVLFSYLTRSFDHRYRFGPGNLPEAQIATVCPVTGALMFIRYECLEGVGVFDEVGYRLGWEDVDYNLRVWLSGRECIYQPGIRAIHHESAFRGGHRNSDSSKVARWTSESWQRFCEKWADQSFAEFVPNLTMPGE